MAKNLSEAVAKAYIQEKESVHYTDRYGSEFGFGFFYPPGSKLTDSVPEDFRWIVEPHWDQFPPINPLYMYMLAFFWIFLWLLNFFGNGVVMYLFLKTRTLRTPSNMLIVNLAFADFIMMMSQSPSFLHSVFGSGVWELGAFHCELVAMLAHITGMGGMYTMVFIGYDRYNVIVKGFNGIKITGKIVLGMILFIWSWVILWSILPMLRVWGSYMPDGILVSCGLNYLSKDVKDYSYATCLFFFAYCVPLMCLIFFYGQIMKSVWDHEEAMREQAKKMNVESLRNEDNKKMSAECRIAKVCMTNVFLWICIWTPYAVVVMMGVWGNQDNITPLVSTIPSMATKTACCVNPVVFAISHPRYRQALQESLPWLCVNEPTDDTKSVASQETTADK